jgi:hypothetical protein
MKAIRNNVGLLQVFDNLLGIAGAAGRFSLNESTVILLAIGNQIN